MEIRSLTPTAFRNLSERHVEFHPGLNLIVGENGQGKTNVIESVAVVSGRPSFRTSDLSDVVREGETAASISCIVRKAAGAGDGLLSVAVAAGSRVHYWQGRKVPRLWATRLAPAVFLTDADLHRLEGPPVGRRRALDRAANALDPRHATNLARYERARVSKNQLLSSSARIDPDQLAVYQHELAEAGGRVAARRRDARAGLEETLAEHAALLGSPYGDLTLLLRSDLPATATAEELVERLLVLQREHEPAERRAKRSLAGPHRDDLDLLSRGQPVTRRASSGERRTLVLAWTLAEKALVARATGEIPLLAFDDFDSEWDRGVLTRFARSLPDAGQVFLTSARPEAVRDLPLPHGAAFRVEGGTLFREGTLSGRRLFHVVSLG